MRERVLSLSAVLDAFVRCRPFQKVTEVDECLAEFDRPIAEVERVAAENASSDLMVELLQVLEEAADNAYL